jgi:hypothetical protein
MMAKPWFVFRNGLQKGVSGIFKYCAQRHCCIKMSRIKKMLPFGAVVNDGENENTRYRVVYLFFEPVFLADKMVK